MDRRILVVHGDSTEGGVLSRALADPGREIKLVPDGTTALELLVDRLFALAVVSVRLPDIAGVDLVREVVSRELPISLILVFDPSDRALAEEGLRQGAIDAIESPVDAQRLSTLAEQALADHALATEVEALEQRLSLHEAGGELIAHGKRMREAVKTLQQGGTSGAAIAVVGEPGTGKTRLARHLHHAAWGRAGRLVILDCGGLPDSILERELLGRDHHDPARACDGAFEAARGGTLVLDDVLALSSAVQSRLLPRLKNLGYASGHAPPKQAARLVMTAGANLAAAVGRGTFRRELLELAEGCAVELPPLREREPQDLVGLFEGTLKAMHERGYPCRTLSPQAQACLIAYHWPGNVRELEEIIGQLVVVAQGEAIEPDDLPAQLANARDEDRLVQFDIDRPLREVTDEVRGRVERSFITKALARCDGRIGETSDLCGISRRTLFSKMKNYRISKGTFRETTNKRAKSRV